METYGEPASQPLDRQRARSEVAGPLHGGQRIGGRRFETTEEFLWAQGATHGDKDDKIIEYYEISDINRYHMMLCKYM